MHPIQMVDLKRQYHKIKKEVDEAVSNVIESTAFINGKPVQEFANNLSSYLGIKHVIPCANGTDALQIAMMALDLKPGDEVITPSFTFIATTEVIALLRLTPVFVEVDQKTFCMDPKALEKVITPRTKAVIPVHLYGHAAPLDEILAIAENHNLVVIEDNAQAIGGDYFSKKIASPPSADRNNASAPPRKTGTLGHIGTTSFFPSKNLGAYGDGGAIFTNDDALGDKMKMIANHGQRKRYYYEMVGCNSRLDTLQAAVLNIKLKHLDEYIRARQAVADFYDNAFADNPKIVTPHRASYCTHVFHQYTLVLNDVDRDGLVAFLAEHKIPSMIYYPVPGHHQQMFSHYETANVSLPVTDWLTERVISLPIHTEMDKEQLEFIASKVLEFANR